MINLDFNDLCSVLRNKGQGHIGIGYSNENTPLTEALQQAIQSPLLDTNISGATNILLNTAGHVDLSELSEAVEQLRHLAGESVNIIWGTVNGDDIPSNQVVITLIATGMNESVPKFIENKTACSFTPSNISFVSKKKESVDCKVTPVIPDIRPLQSRYSQPLSVSKQIETPAPKTFKIPPFLERYNKQ